MHNERMALKTHPITLVPNRFFTWEMLPGYFDPCYGGRYYSPIFIEKVEALATGKGRLRLAFYNCCYAAGAKFFSMEVKVLKRAPGYMLCDLRYDNRAAIITNMNLEWLQCHFPDLIRLGIRNESDIHPVLMRHYVGPDWQNYVRDANP